MRPYFLPKTAENGWISNTFAKSTASDLAANRAGGGAFFAFWDLLGLLVSLFYWVWMKKLLIFLLSFTVTIAILLLAIAGLLIWAPGLLIETLRIGVIAVCIIAGICMLVPLFITIVTTVINGMYRSRKQNKSREKGLTNEISEFSL